MAMTPDAAGNERDLILLREWPRPGRPLWLGIDLVTGDRIVEFDTPSHAHPDHPGAVVAAARAEPAATARDGLLVGEGLLWSLLDPLDAGHEDDAGGDRLAVETALRSAARRFRRRLAWWRGRESGLREDCRRLTAGFRPDLEPLFDILDTALVPPDPSDPAPPAAPGPVAAVSPPAPDPAAVGAWLGSPAGLGALYGPEFAPRVEQATMGERVAAALRDEQALLVEAGTGVGKTLAYLVPLVAKVVAHGTRACVSTHTRALQTQIMAQDLPRLRPLLGERRFTLLMGRRNYLCLRQRRSYLSRPVEDLPSALRAVAFRLWLEETRDGMRDEIAAHPLLAVETPTLFDAADLCLPGLCYEGDRCFVQNARRRARGADVLVVNHSLLLHDQKAGHTLLGEIDHLVVDEAHRLPEVTLETHAVAVGLWRLGDVEELLGQVRGRGPVPERIGLVASRLERHGPEGERASALCTDFAGSVRRVFNSFTAWWQGLGERVDVLLPAARRGPGRVRIRDKDEVFGALRPEFAALADDLTEAADTFARLAGKVSQIDDLSANLEDDLAQLAQAGQLLRQLHADVHFLVADPDDGWVAWFEPGRQRGVARLGATLLEAGGVLREAWQESGRTPIMTSATLAVGDDFTHMMGELGLTRRRPACATHTSPSPFDYHAQALVLTPRHFPDPNAPDFGPAVGELLAALMHGVGRKTMGLFTSYRLIREAADTLATAGLTDDPAAGSDDPVVLAQSPRTATGALLARFRRSRRALLLGTNTFWEGVDFPGEDLEILVVTKLPFLVPNDPWVEARCDRIQAAGENPFTSFMVRDAVLRLRQGFGRLIRRTGDRGVVLILDNRLHTKNYGTTFLHSLPVMPAGFGDTADLLARVNGFFQRT
ncbi:DEAD/DEAH box helicase [bacterium]|nr:DEAD/DEAH box helicase [bacterium]